MLITIYPTKEWKGYHDWYFHQRNDQRKESLGFEKTSRDVEEKSAERYDFYPKKIRWEEDWRDQKSRRSILSLVETRRCVI